MNINEKTLNYIKSITAETITNAKSGHLGSSLGASSILYSLFKDHYNFDVSDCDYVNRDRLVVSAGHVSSLYYTLLSLFGFNVSIEDLKHFRKYMSRTPGHPEYKTTEGVETSTGPLGQGIANAVGMATAEKVLEERFNTVGFPIFSNYTYCFCGDGDLMEGVALEACSLAGKFNLSKLVLLYDCNDVTIDGPLSLSSEENVALKFKAMGWNVIKVANGNKYQSCSNAIKKAKKAKKPTIIIFKTLIGIGTDKEGTSSVHSYVLTDEELESFKKDLKVDESFFFPEDVREHCLKSTLQGKQNHEEWDKMLAVYATSQPNLYEELVSFFLKQNLKFDDVLNNVSSFKDLSSREMNSLVLNEFAKLLPQMIGGTADLGPSTKVVINNSADILAKNQRGRNIHFGVREHAMGAVCNGLALYEDFVVFNATFLAFSNYMIPAIRMSAMMKLPIIYTFTNDSVMVGEDGRTHQPIEQIAQLRLIIGLKVFRPCCFEELIAAYKYSFSHKEPIALILSRQALVNIDGSSLAQSDFGGYVISKAEKKPDIVIYATGSEVALACAVKNALEKEYSISVVSLPCLEVFEEQDQDYKNEILQKNAKLKVVIEASNDNIWYKFINEDDLYFKVDDYQASCPGKESYDKAGFSVKHIVKEILQKIKNQ